MNKILSCCLCVLPVLLYIVIVVPTVIIDIGLELGTIEGSEMILALLIILMVGAFIFVFATYGVMIWLIAKTVERDDMQLPIKAVWCGCLYYLNIFVFPVYWFIYIRKE